MSAFKPPGTRDLAAFVMSHHSFSPTHLPTVRSSLITAPVSVTLSYSPSSSWGGGGLCFLQAVEDKG